MNPSKPTSSAGPTGSTGDFASRLYRLRWILSALVLLGISFAAAGGGAQVKELTSRLAALGDTAGGLEPQPLLFDPRMEIWFGIGDPAVEAYADIERKFVAEDYVVVAFEEEEDELGVFGRRSLATVARLTEELHRVPGVRHVRSLTSAPWIRYGSIDAEEEGLIVSDLVELEPDEIASMTDEELIERMVAVLGARRAADRVGEERVRGVIGPDARFDDHRGEPLMLGTLVDDEARIAAVQVQVLRGRVEDEHLDQVFPEGAVGRETAPTMYSMQTQHAALRGIDHVLRAEQGLAVPTPELAELEAWVASLPEGGEREARAFELADPSRNFMRDARGQLVRKYFEYEPDGSGGWVDRSDPSNPVAAPAGFEPRPNSPYEYHLAGMPSFERNFMDVGMADAKFMGLTMLLIVLVLALSFRSVAGVLGPMVVVFGSIAAMVGTVLSWGDLFNNLTAISPTMLTAVAIADAVHLVAAWSVLRYRYETRREVVIEVIRRNALPVFLTSVTTAVGFYSLTVSQIGPMGMLGYTAGLGTLVAYVASMTILPALLSILPLPRRRSTGEEVHQPGPLSRGLAAWVLARRRGILLVASAFVALAAIGMTRFAIDTDFRAMFPDDNEVMADFHWIESRLGGVGDLEIVFNGLDTETDLRAFDDERARLAELRLRRLGVETAPDEFEELGPDEEAELARLEEEEAALERSRIAASSAFFGELEGFERRLLSEMEDPNSPLRVVTDLTSPLDILRKMHQVQNENAARFYRVPGEEDVAAEARRERLELDPWSEEWSHVPGQSAASLIAQYFLQYENGARPGENLSTQISADRRFFRMQGRVKQAPTMLQQEAFDRVEEIAREEFPALAGVVSRTGGDPLADLTVSGKTVLFSRTPEKFTLGFIESMGIALTVITLLIALIFRSFWIALISIVPNVLPILLPLSYFGLTGQSLDGPAILVASVALGVCVDDTIHFFAKFTKARRGGSDLRQSLVATYDQVGRALTMTSVVLVIGFTGLTLSDFRPNYMMGSLATVMFFLAWVADILVVPALLSYVPGQSEESSQVARGNLAPVPVVASPLN